MYTYLHQVEALTYQLTPLFASIFIVQYNMEHTTLMSHKYTSHSCTMDGHASHINPCVAGMYRCT